MYQPAASKWIMIADHDGSTIIISSKNEFTTLTTDKSKTD